MELCKEGMHLEDHLQPSYADDLAVAGKAKTCVADPSEGGASLFSKRWQ